jgi:DnaJ-class molecular chaperone
LKRFKQAVPAGLTPYAVLGVGPRATDEAIRKQFHALVSSEHPDRRKDRKPGPRWEEINAAYRAIDTQAHRESWRNRIMLMSGGCAACSRYGVLNGVACASCKGAGRVLWSSSVIS